MFDDTPRARLEWALREGLVIAGIVAVWLVVALVLGLAMGLVRVLFEALGLLRFEPLRPVFQLLVRFDLLGRVIVTQIAIANVALYVLVRTGTILVDHYRDGEA